MAKLIFEQKFSLEVGEEKYEGILNDLTKSQKADFNRLNKKKKTDNDLLKTHLKKIKKLERKIQIKEKLEDWPTVDILESDLEVLEISAEALTEKLSDFGPIEDMFKKRIKMSIISDDLEKILDAGEEHGYQNVFQTILEDIEDHNTKK